MASRTATEHFVHIRYVPINISEAWYFTLTATIHSGDGLKPKLPVERYVHCLILQMRECEQSMSNNQMGFDIGIYLADASSTYSTANQPYYGNVRCQGHEQSIWDCPMSTDASNIISECNSNDAVFLYCVRYS